MEGRETESREERRRREGRQGRVGPSPSLQNLEMKMAPSELSLPVFGSVCSVPSIIIKRRGEVREEEVREAVRFPV